MRKPILALSLSFLSLSWGAAASAREGRYSEVFDPSRLAANLNGKLRALLAATGLTDAHRVRIEGLLPPDQGYQRLFHATDRPNPAWGERHPEGIYGWREPGDPVAHTDGAQHQFWFIERRPAPDGRQRFVASGASLFTDEGAAGSRGACSHSWGTYADLGKGWLHAQISADKRVAVVHNEERGVIFDEAHPDFGKVARMQEHAEVRMLTPGHFWVGYRAFATHDHAGQPLARPFRCGNVSMVETAPLMVADALALWSGAGLGGVFEGEGLYRVALGAGRAVQQRIFVMPVPLRGMAGRAAFDLDIRSGRYSPEKLVRVNREDERGPADLYGTFVGFWDQR